jgi:hypothetical protein
VGSQLTDGRVLSATLCEVERGLFYVTYAMDSAALGRHLLPRYQVGTCAQDAQHRIEKSARECGYESVVWETEPTHPSAISTPAEEATRLTH